MMLSERLANSRWVSAGLYCCLVNLRNYIRGKEHTVHPAGGGLYLVKDKQAELYICRRGRHNRSKSGVVSGVERLAAQYNLNLIDAASLAGGTFLDCGANVGELGLWARARGMSYVAFEPEELEARCCDLNNYSGGGGAHRLALWRTSGTLEFHSEPDTADGSLVPTGRASSVKKIRAERLDGLIKPQDLVAGPNILKLEAEGAEPEVLQGAVGILPFLDYVAVDCGPERGAEKRHTFVETCTMLSDAGFRPIAANFDRVTMLYRNVVKQGR